MGEQVNDTLQERGSRYGKFKTHAQVTQDLKETIAMHLKTRGKILAVDQQEALDMICHKIGRIINGDADYIENFRDIAGYAQLVVIRLKESDRATDSYVLPIKRIDGEWINEQTGKKVEVST